MSSTLSKNSSELFNTDKISTFLASVFWFLRKILIFGPVKNQSILLFSVSNFHHSVRSFQKWHFLNTLDFGSQTHSTPWNFSDTLSARWKYPQKPPENPREFNLSMSLRWAVYLVQWHRRKGVQLDKWKMLTRGRVSKISILHWS